MGKWEGVAHASTQGASFLEIQVFPGRELLVKQRHGSLDFISRRAAYIQSSILNVAVYIINNIHEVPWI